MREPVMGAAELEAYLDEVFPQQRGRFRIARVASMEADVAMSPTEADLRPGGTVSGPALFALADCGFYAAVLAMIGRVPLTVTTNLSINFMRKPEPRDLMCEARILKLGRTLAVGDCTILCDGAEGPVAHASVTYAIPPKR
jgi:uncharacterized protein (TIGR00369 family)